MNVTASYNHASGVMTVTMDATTATALNDYLDSIDTADIALNPGYHGYSDDQASAISAAISAIRHKFAKAACCI